MYCTLRDYIFLKKSNNIDPTVDRILPFGAMMEQLIRM
jgi:hypothetical protein